METVAKKHESGVQEPKGCNVTKAARPKVKF